MADDWNLIEVERVIDVYFMMLELQLAGTPFVKASYSKPLATEIGRSKKSVEFKFMNISAVLDEVGAVCIDGYKPATHYQRILQARVLDRLEESPTLVGLMEAAVVAAPLAPSAVPTLGAPVAPPKPAPVAHAPGLTSRAGVFPNYQLIEQQNRALGLAGELAVLNREISALTAVGRDDLAAKVRHVAVEDGDGLGYDVRSFRSDGAVRHLEVKTTREGPTRRFFVSRGEVGFSEDHAATYSLVRVYRFGLSAMRCYELDGSLRASAFLRAETYSGLPV